VKRILVITCAIISLSVSAQEKPARNNWLIKTDLVAYFPSYSFNTGKANIEAERPIGRYNSFALQAAYVYSYGRSHADLINDVSQDHTSGVFGSITYKHYFNRTRVFEPLCLLIWPLVFQLHSIKNENTGLYVSTQVSYLHTLSQVQFPYGVAIGSTVARINPSLLFRIGFMSVSSRKIVIDQSLGFGIQHIKCRAPFEVPADFYSPVMPPISNGFYPFLNYSFKVGLAL
jgi:hypothetical protein